MKFPFPKSIVLKKFEFIQILVPVWLVLLASQPKFTWSANANGCHPGDSDGCVTEHSTSEYGPECMQLCDEHRPGRQTKKYVLNCSEAFPSNDSNRQSCVDVCDKCPSSVCDLSKNPNIFHCPLVKVHERCGERCNTKRPSNGSAFQLKCQKDYDNEHDRNRCKMDCTKFCPFYCESIDESDVIYCPAGPPGSNFYQTSWFIITLILIIPGMILVTVIIWKCIYASRNVTVTEPSSHLHLSGYQDQLCNDPYIYISPNGDADPMVALIEKESKPAAVSSLSSVTTLSSIDVGKH